MKPYLLFALLVGSYLSSAAACDPVETVSDFIESKVLDAGTPDELVEFFTPDAMIVHEGQVTYMGHDEIEEALSWVNHVDVDGDYEVLKTFQSGTLAGVYVNVKMTVTPPMGGDAYDVKYREFYTLVKDRNEFKIALLINNLDVDDDDDDEK